MTPVPTPPPSLVDGGFYSIDIPFTYDGVSLVRPIFQALYDEELDWSLRLAVYQDSPDVFSVWNMSSGGSAVLSLEVPLAAMFDLSNSWSGLVVDRLNPLYVMIFTNSYIEVEGVSNVIYDF